MFEVIEIGRPQRKWRFGRKRVSVKLKATTAMSCELLDRTFEGHGHYTTQTYRADFSEGEVITIVFSRTEIVTVGDQRSIESLAGQGYLKPFLRMIRTNG